METVYLETSFVSLLVGNPSRDLIIAANQQATRDWWRLRREQFVCVVSSEVVRVANVQILGRLEAEAARLGWKLPKVCTPYELMGDLAYETGPDS